MRQDELANAGLPGDLAALSRVQMDGTRSIGRERAVQNGKIGVVTTERTQKLEEL